MFDPAYNENQKEAIIKVVGVGGGGGNALNHMINSHRDGIASVEFYSVNTDAQALRSSMASNTVQIGANTTQGLGAGSNPEKGRLAAEEDREAISNMIKGANMVFLSTGMGGGTGTGATPVIAEIAKNEHHALTVGIVTKPFRFEGDRRMKFAEEGIRELSKNVDSLIIIPNDRLLKMLPKGTKMIEAFNAANDVLRNAVLGITEMITSPGLINVDFADVTTVMSNMGRAMMGIGIAEGEDRAEKVAKLAIDSPLLENEDLNGAKGILVSITSGEDFEIDELNIILDYIQSFASPNAAFKFGTAVNPEWEGKIRVTIVATGIGQEEMAPPQKLAPVFPPKVEPTVEPVRQTEVHQSGGLTPPKPPIFGDRTNTWSPNSFFSNINK